MSGHCFFYNLQELKDLLPTPDNEIVCLLHGQEKASVDGRNIGCGLWAFEFPVTEAAAAHTDRHAEPP